MRHHKSYDFLLSTLDFRLTTYDFLLTTKKHKHYETLNSNPMLHIAKHNMPSRKQSNGCRIQPCSGTIHQHIAHLSIRQKYNPIRPNQPRTWLNDFPWCVRWLHGG